MLTTNQDIQPSTERQPKEKGVSQDRDSLPSAIEIIKPGAVRGASQFGRSIDNSTMESPQSKSFQVKSTLNRPIGRSLASYFWAEAVWGLLKQTKLL